MTTFWKDAPEEPADTPLRTADKLRAARRLIPALLLIGCGLVLLLLIRLIERPVFGLSRPVTPSITKFVCRGTLWFIGLRHVVHGTAMRQPGAIVANHTSWLDIFALNAAKRIYFVSKSEVAGWPGIGLLARATGTVFVVRDRKQASAQKQLFEQRLLAGHKLLFFPEGTSTDNTVVLPFKTTLFAAFFSEELRSEMHIQPVSVVYHAPDGAEKRFYGWWGDMDVVTNILKVVATPRQGSVEVTYHSPLKVDNFADRKALALEAERVVREGHEARKNQKPDAPSR